MASSEGDVGEPSRRKWQVKLGRGQRSRVSLTVSGTPAPSPTIYFLTPDDDTPQGEGLVIYRHVDLLNAAGIAARVMHYRPRFRCTWFENQTQVTDSAQVVLHSNDLLVVTEIDVDLLERTPEVDHVIFSQNAHLTWSRGRSAVARHLSERRRLKGVITGSRHDAEMLAYAFPGLSVHRVHIGINEGAFFTDRTVRARRISYMPRRDDRDGVQVFEILKSRGVLQDWEVVPLEGLGHAAVARELRASRIFMAFGYQEGFSLLAAQAMACGNYVIGYHGYGGEEVFHRDYSAPIATGDVLGFARTVEAAIALETARPGWCRAKGLRASQAVLRRYSTAQEAADVARIYGAILSNVISFPEQFREH